MTRAFLLVVAIAAGCGGKGKGDGPGATTTTPTAAQIVLEGLWADPGYTLSFHGSDYLLRERLPCPRLPCASARTRTGTWSRDGNALHLATTTYDLSVEDGGEVIVLAPVAVAADHQATLRLRRQRIPALAGTSWVADAHTIAFTSETEFTRDAPCDSCENPVEHTTGTWTLDDGELYLTWEGAEESFAVLYETDTLVLIGSTETHRFQRAP
jgi:hypothetical protein